MFALVFIIGLLACCEAVYADTAVNVGKLQFEREENYYQINADLNFDLPVVAEESLARGIPIYFAAEAIVTKDRWYWLDKTVARSERHWRISYQPLTRRWRVVTSSKEITNSGLGVNFGQNFESLEDAMSVIKRISGWRIIANTDLEPDTRHRVEFHFRLDLSQLPKPLSIGVIGESEWNLGVSRSLKFQTEAAK